MMEAIRFINSVVRGLGIAAGDQVAVVFCRDADVRGEGR
jgi:hypothetical protein